MPPKYNDKKCVDGKCNMPPPIKHDPKINKTKNKKELGKPQIMTSK